MASKLWLLKTEPETFSFSTLIKEGKTNWNGVRNFQARNFLRMVQAGDRALIYHSGKEKAVVGVAEVTGNPYPDPDSENPGDWVQMDIRPQFALESRVPLSDIKEKDALRGLLLLKQSRLSVMPITETEFQTIIEMGGIEKGEFCG